MTGIGTNVTISSFFEFNVHNAMFNILVVYGAVTFILTLVLIYMRLEKMREKAFDRFVEEQNAEEVKEIDQLTSYVYGTKEDDDDE